MKTLEGKDVNLGDLAGRRVLVRWLDESTLKSPGRTVGGTQEFRVIEISPSLDFAKLKNLNRMSEWYPFERWIGVTRFILVDVLEDTPGYDKF